MSVDGLQQTKPVVMIDTSDELDRWKWRCPAGHTNWEPTNEHFYCAQCARQAEQGADVEPEFDQLRNARTNELRERDEIEIAGYRAKTA